MKRISIGSKIVGIIDLVFSLVLLIVFISRAEHIEMDRILDDPDSYFPVLCLFAALFKIAGIIILWLKRKFGIAFYSLGCFIFIAFLSIPMRNEREFSEIGGPLLLMYALIAIQFLFIYIMSKSIKTIES